MARKSLGTIAFITLGLGTQLFKQLIMVTSKFQKICRFFIDERTFSAPCLRYIFNQLVTFDPSCSDHASDVRSFLNPLSKWNERKTLLDSIGYYFHQLSAILLRITNYPTATAEGTVSLTWCLLLYFAWFLTERSLKASHRERVATPMKQLPSTLLQRP